MMDVISDQHRHPCWICHGTGRAELLADSTTQICAMCAGSGLVASVPATTSEMVAAMAAVPNVPRYKFTPEDYARIDELEEIVRAVVAQMRAEGEFPDFDDP